MIGVDKIQDIREMWRKGHSVAEIARVTGVSEPTVRKYRDMDDLSPKPPKAHETESELIAPHAATIDGWLRDDTRYWRKQRHTAVRVFVRLRDEKGYEGSYSTVQRYVRKRREEMACEVEKAETAEKKKELIEEAGMELDDEELEQVSGGLGNLKNPIVYIGKAL